MHIFSVDPILLNKKGMGFMMQKHKRMFFLEPKLFLALVTVLLILVVLFYCVTSMIISVGYQTFANAVNPDTSCEGLHSITVVLDAGHGGEDPGAVANQIVEKELNLAITDKLAAFFRLSGYRVVLTRSEDRLLYNSGEEDRKKYYDLYNRLKIAESYDNAVFVSIHMNKFSMEECKGLQTFYTDINSNSVLLAQSIQSHALLLDDSNHRQPKDSKELIFLLKNLKIPSVLVECGFISNPSEAQNLSEEEYQNQLAFSMYCGICAFLEEYQVENQLYMQ